MKEKPTFIAISKGLHRAIKIWTAKAGVKIGAWTESKLREALKREGAK